MPDENNPPDEPPVALPDLLQRSREVQGEQVLYRFGNGLRIKTEIFRKNDRLRILPLGTPQGNITSNGGPEGNRFVAILLKRLEEFLRPEGQAFIYLFQIVRRGEPLVVDLILQYLDHRAVELTPSQAHPISFAVYCQTYSELFPTAEADIARWQSELIRRHGKELMLSHYVAHVGPRGAATTSYVIRNNFREKYGEDLLVPFGDDKELAYGRILENVVDFGK